MHLYELIEQGSEIEGKLGPMPRVFIKNEEDQIVAAYQVTTEEDEKGVYIVVIG